MNASSRLLPEFYLDKVDRGGVLSAIFQGDLRVAAAVCALMAFLALLFVALRARRLRLRTGETAATIALVLLCMSSRAGIAFDAGAWCFAALLLLVADLGERYRWYLPAIVLAWSVAVDSGTIGAAILTLRALGDLIDERAFTVRVRQMLGVAFVSCIASTITAAGPSFVFSAARALYFDMLLPGADRQPLWTSPLNVSALGVFAIVAIAAIGGIARKRSTGEVLVFVTLLVAAVLDVRMAPFFGIAVAPALAALYAPLLKVPRIAGVAAAAAAIAIAIAVPPPANDASLLTSLADGRPHRVVCIKPSWCDPVMALWGDRITALTVGVPSASPARDRLLQKRIDEDSAAISGDLKAAGADALLANEQTAGSALLLAEGGWRIAARNGASGHVLIVKEPVQ